MALLIAPLFTAGIAVGGIQNAYAGFPPEFKEIWSATGCDQGAFQATKEWMDTNLTNCNTMTQSLCTISAPNDGARTWLDLNNDDVRQQNEVIFGCVLRTINVDIDIKPNSDPNSINTKSMGLVPVAILGSETFDVADVDVTTLMFGNASPAHDLTDSDTYNEHIQDVNDDGFDDLVSHYKQKDTGIVCSDTEATLTGELFDGTPIEGTDSVNPKCKP